MSSEDMEDVNQRPIMNEDDVLEEMRKVLDYFATFKAVMVTEMKKTIAYYETRLIKF